MAAVQPIKDKLALKESARFIAKQGLAYQAIYHIGIGSGFRTTDITELQWEDIDFKNGTVTIAENKGTRQAQARQRLKVLEQVKNELIALNADDTRKMMQLFITKVKDIYELIPNEMLKSVDQRIEQAMTKAKAKIRTAKLSPKALTALRELWSKFGHLGEKSVFHRMVLRNSNRAKNDEGVITRQSVYKLFKRLEAHLVLAGHRTLNLGAHSARKTSALCLYIASNHNIALVMSVFGWSSEAMVLRYLCIGENESASVFDEAFNFSS
jgi:integrase